MQCVAELNSSDEKYKNKTKNRTRHGEPDTHLIEVLLKKGSDRF